MQNSMNLFENNSMFIIEKPEPPVLSVSDASNMLKKYVEDGFRSIRVKGEISGFKKHTSGHSYFVIKDEGAVMDAVAWRGTSLPVPFEDGLEVIIQGRITTYPGRSKYQIIAEKIEAAGKGALMALYLERKDKYQREGLFDRSRPIPKFPKKIGIVTSLTGAVIKDILHRLNDRFPLHVLVWPAQVQGQGAAEQVKAGIIGFNQLSLNERPDVIIVARGGGSLEDLWAFNEEVVVRAVFASEIPIISAIGHETDTTLCDFAADLRAPTPTAAAELATPVASQLLAYLEKHKEALSQTLIKRLRMDWTYLKGLSRGLPQPQHLIDSATLRFDDLMERIERGIVNVIHLKHHKIQSLPLKHPSEVINLNSVKFESLCNRFERSARAYYQEKEKGLDVMRARLAQSNYTKILEKGFSWVSVDEAFVGSANAFPKSASDVTLHFADGSVKLKAKSASITIASS